MNIHELLDGKSHIFIKQIKEWGEIILNFESKNRYALRDESGKDIGYLFERGDGVFQWLMRLLLRSHRPLLIELVNHNKDVLLKLERGFFWFFSDLKIEDSQGLFMGSVHRRFGIFNKKYDLYNREGVQFARIQSGLFSFWTFKVFDLQGREISIITKKWGGIFSEVFTDSDQFGVSLKGVNSFERVVLLSAAISIDFDFFEDNSSRNG